MEYKQNTAEPYILNLYVLHLVRTHLLELLLIQCNKYDSRGRIDRKKAFCLHVEFVDIWNSVCILYTASRSLVLL